MALPVRPIPGSYGLPVFGPLKDRLDYFWFQGPDTFFRDRMAKHKSTVFRTNMPPTFPFYLGVKPNMVAVVDVKSFTCLFDMESVEKKDVLIGDYMPSVSFTGDMRVLAYLDTTESRHAALKGFIMDILKRSSNVWVSEFLKSVDDMFDKLEEDLSSSGTAGFFLPLQQCLFNFLTKSIVGADPAARPAIEKGGLAMLDAWLALMIILPTQKVGSFPQPLQEILFHSFPIPSFITSGGYRALYNFVEEEGKETVKRGMEEFDLTKEEVINNLLFVLGFNAFGGFSVFLPTLLSTIGRDKTGLKAKLKAEARSKGEELNFQTVKEMEMVNSTVYETLRLNPPVALQYARARKDFVLASHDSSFEIKKGELLCGYQPLAMRDPKVFDRAEEFVADRFAGEGGKELLNYLFWSNGPQTATPSTANKQCAAKEYVVGTLFLLVAAIFKRYDEFVVDENGANITKLVKAGEGDC